MSQSPRRSSRGTGASRKATPAAARVKVGASQRRTGLSDRFDAYLSHHIYSASSSLQRLLASPLQSLLTWLVVAIAIALPAFFFVALGNVEDLGQRWQGKPQLSVYLQSRARTEAITALQKRVESRPDVQTVTFISAQQALQEFETSSGLGSALQTLDENPLPPVFIVQPANYAPEALQALRLALAKEAIVSSVQLDMDWVLRLNQMLQIAERLVLALGLLLGFGVLLVIGNTIRLAIENRRAEIVVVKLVGGTDGFVRRPFLYTGLWYGLGGGLLALLLLLLALFWLSGPVAGMATLYGSAYSLQGLGFGGTLVLLFGAGLLGLLGAWLAVGRHLNAIEPT